jgi:tripartite-type tricarboxylate transporter receptor subunit TctC
MARIIAQVAALLIAGLLTTTATAQSYPDRRITFVVPYPAGGATDVTARVLANRLAEIWGQPVTVENKPGGGGIVGNDFVAKSPADGYTVLVAITQIIQAPSLGQKLPYDVFRDLAPVSHVALSTVVLTTPAQQPFKTVKDLVDAAKASGGKLNYGSFGNATTSHLYGELLKKTAGIEMAHVPYRGAAPLLNDLLGNQVSAGFIDLTTGGAQIKAGGLRALAVGGEKRRTALPDTPTMAELGYPGFEAEGWVGIFVPAATPKPIIDKLSAELDRIIKSPEGTAKLEAVSLMPVGGTAEDFAAALKRDAARWAETTRISGVKAE